MKRQIGLLRRCLLGMATAGMLFAFCSCLSADGSDAKDLVETLDGIGELRTFTWAVHQCMILDILSERGPFTIFAPNEEAFLNLPVESIGMLFSPDDRDALEGLLACHVAPDVVLCSSVIHESCTTALSDEVLTLVRKDGAVYVRGARIVKPDIRCKNGVIHIIDQVILNND
ncbi:MAG: fasciclin domain-containing protein [Desulfomonilia bacterium]|nr:fasciclin domain-containing protein [Deltaproteobacteria bacterium]MDX9761254.1 fasciclin domain-containing protein [Desulfomonilia bacterium]